MHLNILNLILTVSVIGIIVIFHELGHYFIARLNGAQVKEFSIGFGPNIISYVDKRQTKWVIKLLPLGGYIQCEEQNLRFFPKVFLYLGGPIGNLIFSIFISFISLYYFGQPANKMYLNNNEISAIEEVYIGSISLESNSNQKMYKIILKDNSFVMSDNIKQVKETLSYNRIGLVKSIICSIKYSVNLFIKTASHLIRSIKNMSLKLNGPVSVIKATKNIIANHHFADILNWLIILSIGLGVINLMPILPLDGGRILHEVLNLISPRFARVFSGITMYIAFAIMIFVMFKDISPFFKGMF
ncbi:M50 family metallopeptidase [Candidatus Cytomitobacter primus]|uniref:Site-2 protease family protein n=1 Tax=Candidatus Cytomitobacter primus TaxID=2066024 RepID=A0A5C0UGB4_9PROT|nr:M50 family metallopeptidase [Candidatus Cytomitobacter primus]QEK38770.1 site-2 protease family protein [Candidatus Cytomitobacter primus]